MTNNHVRARYDALWITKAAIAIEIAAVNLARPETGQINRLAALTRHVAGHFEAREAGRHVDWGRAHLRPAERPLNGEH